MAQKWIWGVSYTDAKLVGGWMTCAPFLGQDYLVGYGEEKVWLSDFHNASWLDVINLDLGFGRQQILCGYVCVVLQRRGQNILLENEHTSFLTLKSSHHRRPTRLYPTTVLISRPSLIKTICIAPYPSLPCNNTDVGLDERNMLFSRRNLVSRSSFAW